MSLSKLFEQPSTSGRQLKTTFFDVLDYSEYSDTNISKFFFPQKHSFLSKEATSVESIETSETLLYN